MPDVYVVLLSFGLMFGVTLIFVNICWHFDEKRINKELEERYGENWRDKF